MVAALVLFGLAVLFGVVFYVARECLHDSWWGTGRDL